MSTLNELSGTIAADLEQDGFLHEASEVRRLTNISSNAGNTAAERRAALKTLARMAHVRWLGDLCLPHLDQREWWGKLDRLKKNQ